MRLLPIILLLGYAAAQNAAPRPIGELESKDATVRGAVEISGSSTHIQSGAQVSAGDAPAKIKLTRGGEFDLCPGASVTLTSSASAREHLIALHSGAVETHYPLSTDSDTLLTPDFRIQLPGPGEFHFAIGLLPQGDACIESLPGDTASIIVSEQFGDGTHQVRPGEHLLFRHGTVRDAEGTLQPCGCMAHKVNPQSTDLHFPEEQSQAAAAAKAAGKEVPAPPPPVPDAVDPGQVHVVVEAPMVFRADEIKLAKAKEAEKTAAKNEPPAPKPEAAAPPPAQPPAAEPAPPLKPKKRNFFQRFGDAISRFFGGGKKSAKQQP